MNKYYVYAHFRADNEQIFYIGKGAYYNGEDLNTPFLKRASDSCKRSSHWKKVANKYGCLIKIVKRDLSEQDAFNIEIDLISKYGRIDNGTGILVNQTKGGDGAIERVWTNEARQNLSDSKSGIPNYKIRGNGNGKSQKIAQLDLLGNILNTFDCIKDAVKFMNIKSHGRIQQCCSGVPYDKRGFPRKTAYGFKWKYI